MMDDPSKEVSRISGESIVTSDVGQDAVLISVDKVSNDSSFKNQKNTVYDVFDFSDQSTLPFFEIQKNVIDFQEKLVSATTEFPLLNKISPTHISIMSKSLFYKLFDYFSEQWVNEQAMKKFVNVRFVTKGIKQKKFISFLRRIIPNVLYHWVFANADSLSYFRMRYALRGNETVAILNATDSEGGRLKNLIFEKLPSSMTEKILPLVFVHDDVRMQLKRIVANMFSRTKQKSIKAESFLTVAQVFVLSIKQFRHWFYLRSFITFLQTHREFQGIVFDNKIRSIIRDWYAFDVFSIYEYRMIAEKLWKSGITFAITDCDFANKIGTIIWELREKKVKTVAIQHGIMTEPYLYYPNADIFGCSSENAKALMLDDGFDKERIFIAGLPPQLQKKTRRRTQQSFPFKIGLADSNDSFLIKLYRIKVLAHSQILHTYSQVYVRSHPSKRHSDGIVHFYNHQSFVFAPKGETWDVFATKVSFVISFSLDAAYEILQRGIPVIVVDYYTSSPKALFNKKFYHARSVSTSKELDTAVEEIQNHPEWFPNEWEEVMKDLEYKFGNAQNNDIVNVISSELD